MYKLLYTMLSICLVQHCFSQPNWELVKNDEGIKVYTRNSSSSKIKEFKAITYINTSLEKLVTKIIDGNNLKSWNYKTSKSKLISKEEDTITIVYMYNDFPWPIKNRDHISRLQVYYINTNTIKITIDSDANRLPENEDAIRVKVFSGYWLLEQQKNTIKVTQQMHGDPNGYLPPFFVNAMLTKAPYYTFKNLKEQLEE